MLQLEYGNKYRLWSDMVRGNTDRVFVPTDQKPEIGSHTAVELRLPELTLPIVLRGSVVGRRPKSRRFTAGVFIRFDQKELDKCRKLLHLSQSPDRYGARRKKRVACEVPVRLVKPAIDVPLMATALSTGGCAITTRDAFLEGQRVDMALRFEDEVTVTAEVVWANSETQQAGFRFVDADDETQAAITAHVDRLIKAEEALQTAASVVIADDDAIVRNLIQDALQPFGYEIHRATNGDEALALIRLIRPSLILLDVLMPGLDGVDIVKIIRSDEGLADTPVIFLSALDPDEMARLAEEAGASDFLSKGEDLTILINLVGEYLKG